MFSIGEFSKMTGLTVKALRFYHEQSALVPVCVDPETGYRYYRLDQVETARVIAHLRSLEFTVEQIRELLTEAGPEVDVIALLTRQRQTLREKARHFQGLVKLLDNVIHREQEARMATANPTFEIKEKVLEPLLMAGIRMRGRYSDCGQAFGRISRGFGRYLCGPCFLLHYDTEYKEEDADFEACMPVQKALAVEGISVRELRGGRCVSLQHRGPYDTLGRSYERLLTFLKSRGEVAAIPTREIYLKGPGMIFRGNPKNYLTEIQFLIGGH